MIKEMLLNTLIYCYTTILSICKKKSNDFKCKTLIKYQRHI